MRPDEFEQYLEFKSDSLPHQGGHGGRRDVHDVEMQRLLYDYR